MSTAKSRANWFSVLELFCTTSSVAWSVARGLSQQRNIFRRHRHYLRCNGASPYYAISLEKILLDYSSLESVPVRARTEVFKGMMSTKTAVCITFDEEGRLSSANVPGISWLQWQNLTRSQVPFSRILTICVEANSLSIKCHTSSALLLSPLSSPSPHLPISPSFLLVRDGSSIIPNLRLGTRKTSLFNMGFERRQSPSGNCKMSGYWHYYKRRGPSRLALQSLS